jgi:hypothetical protein
LARYPLVIWHHGKSENPPLIDDKHWQTWWSTDVPMNFRRIFHFANQRLSGVNPHRSAKL